MPLHFKHCSFKLALYWTYNKVHHNSYNNVINSLIFMPKVMSCRNSTDPLPKELNGPMVKRLRAWGLAVLQLPHILLSLINTRTHLTRSSGPLQYERVYVDVFKSFMHLFGKDISSSERLTGFVTEEEGRSRLSLLTHQMPICGGSQLTHTWRMICAPPFLNIQRWSGEDDVTASQIQAVFP